LPKLPREFYERNTIEVARELLGKFLVHESTDGQTIGKIVEVEAYIGPDDKASHAFKGLRSARTEVQFGPGGYAYIYLIYGMYYCFNFVTNMRNYPEVVLLRALEPIAGIETMNKWRQEKNSKNLCNGPGKLCQAMGITKKDYGADLCGDTLYVLDEEPLNFEIGVSTRINIDYADEYKFKPWRFFIKGNRFVSN
jgi:DNA-3-methyladenine glycosylase